MNLPRQLQVGRKLYTVSQVQCMSRKYSMGHTAYVTKQILIASKPYTLHRSYTLVEIEDTFWHELTHAILEEMGSAKYDDEVFVDRFSKRLSKAIRTAKF